MPVIGWDQIGPSTDATSAGFDHTGYVTGSGFTYTAVSGDVVTSFNCYGDGTGQVEMAIYTVVGGLPNTRVGSSAIVAVGATAGWYSTTVSIPLTAGVEYTVALRFFVDETWNIRWEAVGSSQQSINGSSTTPLPATWTNTGNDTGRVSYYAGIPGTATNLTVADANHAQATGPLVLVPVSPGTLTGLDSAHAHTATTVTLALGDLTIQNASHAQSAGNLSFIPFPFPVAISGRKIVDQNGRVYLMRSMASWGMAQLLTNAEITQALTGVASVGFNAVTVVIGGAMDYGGVWHQYQNAAGQQYWTGFPWASTFGPAWASDDWVLTEALRLGLTVNVSIFSSYNVTGAGDESENAAVTNATMNTVGRTIAARWPVSSYPNIVWHLEFDTPDSPASIRGQRAKALFNGINTIEGPTTRPVRWLECNQTASTFNQGWLNDVDAKISINCWYNYNSNAAEIAENGYAEVTSVPVGDCEPPYDGATHYGTPPSNPNVAQNLRERSYCDFIEGGILINWGHEDWWPFNRGGLFTEGLTWQQVPTHVHTIEASYCWTLLDRYVADASWAPTSSLVTSGELTGGEKAAVGMSNTAAIAYFPTRRGGGVADPVVVDTTQLPGTNPVQLRWYDPTSGAYTSIATSEAQNAARAVTYPAAHADGSFDWVLVIDLVLGVANAAHVLSDSGPITLTASGPGSVTLAGLDSFHAHSNPNILVTLGTLSGLDSFHAHSATTITLAATAGPVTLTIPDSFHAHTNPSPTLSVPAGPVNLVVQAAAHSQQSTTVPLGGSTAPSHSTIYADVTATRTTPVIPVVVPIQFND